MHRALERTIMPASPFVDPDGSVDVKGFCDELEIDQATLARALGVSRQSVSQQLKRGRRFVKPRSKKARRFWHKLDRMYTLLLALTDADNPGEEIRQWFRSPNRALGMDRPVDLFRRGELDQLIKMLDDVLEAAHGG